MIVDPRAGSKDYVAALRKYGIVVEEGILPAGDVEIRGHGPQGREMLVAVEIKQVGDMLACARDGRFADQLRRMRDRYDVCWLLVEGHWAGGNTPPDVLLVLERGRVVPARGQYTYTEIAGWLLTMTQAGGVLLWLSPDRDSSVRWLCALNAWWTKREYDDHRSHLAIYSPPPTHFVPPTPAAEVARCIPGIGWDKAMAVAEILKSPHDVVTATEERWRQVPGVGKTLAARAVRWAHAHLTLNKGGK